MISSRLLPVMLVLVGLAGCDKLLGAKGPEVCNDANALLRAGDLPAAEAAYEALAPKQADNPCVVTGRSYMRVLAGDFEGADKILAASEENAGDKLAEVKLRRALVALESENFDGVREHGTASGLPAGKLLAAEVHLTDLESDKATALFKEVEGTGGEVGSTAHQYLAMLESGGGKAGLAELTAMWALGNRKTAVESVAELAGSIEEDEEKAAVLLLWAGRAATAGEPAQAKAILDMIDFPPEGQGWRVQAVGAIADVALGQGAIGVETFAKLEAGGAPADGLADARATAACLTDDKELAKTLVGDGESAAGARCLDKAGAGAAAKRAAPVGTYKTFLETR